MTDERDTSSPRFPKLGMLLDKVAIVETKHLARKTNHELDHALWRLDEYVLEEVKHDALAKEDDYPSYTSNAPRTLSRVVSAMTNKNDILIQFLQGADTPDEERQDISNNEAVVYGGLYEVNRVRAHRGASRLQWEISWYIIHRGGAIVVPLWVPGDKRVQWRAATPDPMECAWEPGVDCQDFFVRHYVDDTATVESTWDVKGLDSDSAQMTEVFDIWWIDRGVNELDDEGQLKTHENEEIPKIKGQHVVYNAVIAGSKHSTAMFLKMPTAHDDFDCTPVYIHRSGGFPGMSDVRTSAVGAGSPNAISDQWEGIYTGVRQTIGWLNRAVTLYGLYLRSGAIGPYLYKGRKNKEIKKGLKPFNVVSIDVNEDFGPVAQPQMAPEMAQLLDFVKSEWQKAGVSDIVFGDAPFAVSGFGMLQLRGAVEILISSYIQAIEEAYVSIASEWMKQFIKKGRNRKVSLKGFDSDHKAFTKNIKTNQVSKEYIIEATLNQGLPEDHVQMGNAAQQWRQAGVPLEKIFEKVFQFRDGHGMAKESAREAAEALPPVMLANALDAYSREGDGNIAKILAILLQQQGFGESNSSQSKQQGNGQGGGQPTNVGTSSEVAAKGEQEGKFGGGGRPPRG